MNGLNWRLVPHGSETGNIAVVTGFMPAWWETEYNITFGTAFHTDSRVHQSTLAAMEDILRERFGDLPNFFCGDDYAHSYPCERRYGDAFIPALFGASVSFEDESGHPYAGCMELDDQQVENLSVPDIKGHPAVLLLIDEHKGGFARLSGELGFEGVLNIAYKLRGQEIFIDMIQKKELFHHLCSVVWETIDGVVHLVRAWQDPHHERPSYFVTADCLINMISGWMYDEQLLEFDRLFSESFELFGIHTCNWTVDPYLEAMARFGGRMGYLDMGPESDLEKVHRLFPELRPAVFFHPEQLREMDAGQVRKRITELCEKLHRGYILLSDLEAGTEDKKIRMTYEIAARY